MNYFTCLLSLELLLSNFQFIYLFDGNAMGSIFIFSLPGINPIVCSVVEKVSSTIFKPDKFSIFIVKYFRGLVKFYATELLSLNI